MQILIVQPDERLAGEISQALRTPGPHRSLHIVKGLRAAEALIEGGQSIDVALVDLGLPDASGIEAPLALRMADPDMAIVVMADGGGNQLKRELLRHGIQDYLPRDAARGSRILRAVNVARQRAERERRLHNNVLVKITDGVLNKLGFYIALRRCIECIDDLGVQCGLLAIELNGLDEVIRAHGTTAGELAMRQACSRVCHVIRRRDAVARSSDDVLYVLLNGVSKAGDLRLAADKVRERFDTPLYVNTPMTVSLNIGGALFPTGATTVREWLTRATTALDQARKSGGERTVIADDGDDENIA